MTSKEISMLTMENVTLMLSQAEVQELISALAELAMQMDDDGREGAFNASPLKPIYDKLRRVR